MFIHCVWRGCMRQTFLGRSMCREFEKVSEYIVLWTYSLSGPDGITPFDIQHLFLGQGGRIKQLQVRKIKETAYF
ncbi:hypothetical protein FQN60_014974 [Etheostoma spectabile]|uniref:Uncharacterized protein n=1 Tax=Etheostoma spectabile TaxID=54343 RepID=A0A5J5CSY1_9PERO|nr:hypothetical protein FQN60_014974 [Etheostoma spectabile]